MIIKARGTVTTPRRLTAIGQLMAWGSEVNRSIQQLRDRCWDVPNGVGGSVAATATTYIPWDPQFFTEISGETLTYKCNINLGTFNGVAASNWDDDFTLPSDDSIKFVVLTITTGSGQVTEVSISIDDDPPAEDFISADTPPVSFSVALGAIGRSSAQMIIAQNIQAVAAEVFREGKTAPVAGSEPFSRWWRWNLSLL